MNKPSPNHQPPHAFIEVFLAFLRLGFTAFGGPVAHIGYFRHEFVERRRWLNEQQFAHYLALCQFMPGPASSQLGLLLGLNRAGWPGAASAFIAFTAPSALALYAFAIGLPYLQPDWSQTLISGLKLVALCVVAHAVIGMFQQFCQFRLPIVIAILSFAALLLLPLPWLPLVIIATAAVIGFLRQQQTINTESSTRVISTRLGIALLTAFSVLLLIALLIPVDARYGPLAQFYQAGALVFGGGHVVLPLLQGALVGSSLITASDFLAGYGAVQSVPGPLFTFASYLGTILPGPFNGGLGALLATLAIFLPGFLLILGALPFWHALMGSPRAAGLVTTVNAAVVGILAAALYNPIATSALNQWSDVGIALIGLLLLRRGYSALWVILWCLTMTCLLAFF